MKRPEEAKEEAGGQGAVHNATAHPPAEASTKELEVTGPQQPEVKLETPAEPTSPQGAPHAEEAAAVAPTVASVRSPPAAPVSAPAAASEVPLPEPPRCLQLEHRDVRAMEDHDVVDDPSEEGPYAPEAAAVQPGEGKQRSLEQMMSLKPGDDERTEMSKKLSWILRHGAKNRKVEVTIDPEGWVSFDALLTSDILFGTTEAKLLDVVDESNALKTRYEVREVQGRKQIRAVSKSRRVQAARQERAERTRERPPPERLEPGRIDRSERPPRSPRKLVHEGDEDQRDRRNKDASGWWDRPPPSWAEDAGPTYEEQVAEGWMPVYQGSRIVAMARGLETCRPGRRVVDPRQKGEGKGDSQASSWGSYSRREGEKGEWDGGWKGERKGKGKGKFDRGEKGEEKGRHGADGDEGKGHGRRDGGYGPRIQNRWTVVAGADALVRAGPGMETDIVCRLPGSTLVAQIGEDKVLKNGIVRMNVEALEPPDVAGARGWVTRSAEAAGGPVYFHPAPAGASRDRPSGKGRGGGGGGAGKGGGKGRRPIGEGDAMPAGPFDRPPILSVI